MTDIRILFEEQGKIFAEASSLVAEEIAAEEQLFERTKRLRRAIIRRNRRVIHVINSLKSKEKSTIGKTTTDREEADQTRNFHEQEQNFRTLFNKEDREADELNKIAKIESRIPHLNKRLKTLLDAQFGKPLNENTVKEQEKFIRIWHAIWIEKRDLLEDLARYEHDINDYETFGTRFMQENLAPFVGKGIKMAKETSTRLRKTP